MKKILILILATLLLTSCTITNNQGCPVFEQKKDC